MNKEAKTDPLRILNRAALFGWFAIMLAFTALLLLSGCGACYREDKNPDGTWPSYCGDRFDAPNPTKK